MVLAVVLDWRVLSGSVNYVSLFVLWCCGRRFQPCVRKLQIDPSRASWFELRMPLADSQTLGELSPLCSALLAWLLLSERLTRIELLGVFYCAALGVLLPVTSSESSEPLGVVLGVLAATASAGVYVLLRFLAKLHWASAVLWQGLGQVLLAPLGLSLGVQSQVN